MAVFNSKLYVMTKNQRQGGGFDLNVYSFDPTTDRKSIRLCNKSAAPRLMDSDNLIVFIDPRGEILCSCKSIIFIALFLSSFEERATTFLGF